MTDNSGTGSQAGQGGSGTQAVQGNAGQGQQGGAGAQAAQTQTREEILASLRFDGMQEGESVEQAFARLNGALATSRKQSAGYRTRLRAAGLSESDDAGNGQGDGNGGQGAGSGSQAGQGQQGGDSAIERRLASLETALRTERQTNRTEKIERQLLTALEAEGAVKPSRTLRQIDLDALDISDDGTVTDPLGAVRALKAEMPMLFGDVRGSADGNAGNAGTGNPGDFNAQIRARAGIR